MRATPARKAASSQALPHLALDPSSAADWHAAFEAAYADAVDRQRSCLPAPGQELAVAAWPLAEAACAPVAERVMALATAGFADAADLPALYAGLTASLWDRLFGVMGRTMVIELAAAQEAGLLHGANENERYDFFIACLSDPQFAAALLEQHESLSELISTICVFWSEAVAEMLDRIHSDWIMLGRRFFPTEQRLKLNAIRLARGDPHNCGRTVAILEFNGGVRLVYKPRPMAIEVEFARFAGWLNTVASEDLLAHVEVLDMRRYGWCGFVESRPLDNRDRARLYHRRVGALIAVSRILGLTDIHHENLVAAGEMPVIVDLETMFHPLTGDLFPQTWPTPAEARIERMADESVQASGLLPIRSPYNTPASQMNIAGMANVEGLETGFDVPQWEAAGTEGMRIVQGRVKLGGSGNLPFLEGKPVPPEDYRTDVTAGFEAAYLALLRERTALLSEDGPLQAFARHPIRVVIRPTQHYLEILANAAHPELLSDTVARLTWLESALPAYGRRQRLGLLVRSERAAILRNDVPYFETTPDSLDLTGCDGRRYIGALARTGLETVFNIVRSLGSDDLRRQRWLIYAALTKADASHGEAKLAKRPQRQGSANGVTADMAERVVRQALSEICGSAVSDGGFAGFMTIGEGAGGTLVTDRAGLDLYSGLPGIALFLGHAGSVLNDGQAKEIGRAVMRNIFALIRNGAHEALGLGGHAGLGGLAYALSQLAPIHPDLPTQEAFNAVVKTMAGADLGEAKLEFMDGLAGALLGLKPCASTARLRAKLLSEICSRVESLGHDASGDKVFGNPGMAHGIRGLQAALAAQALSGLQDTLALRAAVASDKLHRPAFQARAAGAARPGDLTWCAGLSGIVLGLSLARKDIGADKAAPLAAALRADEFSDDSLCHGSAGALLALRASAFLRCAQTNRIAASLFGKMARNGPRCGTIGAVSSPALMDGLSGIGFAALSFCAYAALPNVLILEHSVRGLAAEGN